LPAVTAQPPAANPADPNAAVRRDYELALQISTKAVWDSFVSNYPSGFYADLAKAQRDKLKQDCQPVRSTASRSTAAQCPERNANASHLRVVAIIGAKPAANCCGA
jgi:hypothetical protein